MRGIDLNRPAQYQHASFRFFQAHEHHVTRFCRDNVLLLVYHGVLRFSEDGQEQEVHAGEYYIQRANCQQAGKLASDAPQYFYVHFGAEWGTSGNTLPARGRFDYARLCDLMKRLDLATHQKQPYCERQYLFLKLLLALWERPAKKPLAQALAEYVEEHLAQPLSLAELCTAFHYSKNYIIRVFERELGASPVRYINSARLKRAMYLLETTSKPICEIAAECGYSDYAYFYRCFVQENGAAPLAWRKQVQRDPLRLSGELPE